MRIRDPELEEILLEALKSSSRVRKALDYARSDAAKRANRLEFERRFKERLSIQTHSVALALNDEPLDAQRFRHWFIFMRLTPPPASLYEWRRLIDLDILRRKELET